MESITKNRQSLDALKSMIERAYGPGRVPVGDDIADELGHGWFNVAYRVRLADGAEVVLKIAPPADVEVMSYEHEMMRNELTALALVQEHTGVPVPRIDFADTTRTLCDADWFTMPYIDADNFGVLLESGRVAPDESDLLHEQLGAVTRELNSVIGPHFGPLRGPGFATWREAFTGMIGDVLRDGERADVDLGRSYAELREVVAAHADALDEVVEPRFVEWDLWPGNTMVRDGRIVAIIDHERALWGDPLIEGGFTGIDLAAFGDPSAFLRGYGRDAADLTETERRRRRLYTLYLVLVMIVETRYRGHAEPWQYDWSRARLDELMPLFG
ncbi:phosphotransferase family protein [Agromyces larvae]|uniref:Aminoglycoside phosphotransferase family protein n=1 Tax=Agromyces larvae TaxID=2929802 RepID=A0ABY4C330_9MICO|nr:aminoglycoside phosphotransferase family protein [Agromyces larvae]UOE45609.1 aminoglycoside phosphotransferase family protein [Agromyces larvae]